MHDKTKDWDQNFRTIIFLGLLLFLFLASSNSQGNHNTRKPSLQNEALWGSVSHHDAAIGNTCNYDLQKFKCTADNARFLGNQSLVYDHKSASSFISLQKSRLSVISLSISRIFLHHFPEKDSDPPASC